MKPDERKGMFGKSASVSAKMRPSGKRIVVWPAASAPNVTSAWMPVLPGPSTMTKRTRKKISKSGRSLRRPGFEAFDAGLRGEYGFGTYANVVTSIQFERILSASGRYFGHVQRLSDGKEPRRNRIYPVRGLPGYLLRQQLVFVGLLHVRDKGGDYRQGARQGLEPTIFFMDIRAHGKDFDRFVNRAKGEYGIRYVRSMPSTVKELQETKNLLIKYVREDGSLVEEEFDMMVLSVGLTPPKEAAKLSSKPWGSSSRNTDFAGLLRENPVQTTREGVFVCGAFGGPKDIPETVMEASGAAACAEGLLAARRGTTDHDGGPPDGERPPGGRPGTGVFVCHCGINIGGVVDVPCGGGVCENAAQCGLYHGQPLHLLAGYGGQDGRDDQGAQPDTGGRRLLFA